MKIAVCASCKIVISAGNLPDKVTSKGKKVPYVYKHTFKKGVDRITHEAVLKDLPDTPQDPGESPGDYLKRLWKIHAG